MAIDINDFSDGKEVQNNDGSYEWQGSKIFDKIMIAVNGNIKTEYDNGRITGAEYATVYLGALQSSIAEATKIVVNKELIDAQKEQIDKQISNMENQDLLTLAQIGKTKIEADVEASTGAKKIDLLEAQTAEAKANTEVIEQKIIGRKQ